MKKDLTTYEQPAKADAEYMQRVQKDDLWARVDAIAEDLPGDGDIGTDLKALATAIMILKNSR